MPIERNGSRYAGPKLFPDSREIIYDTPIAELDQGAQEVYLEGGYHSLIGPILNGLALVKTLTAEQEAFLRNRLVRELIDCTSEAHKDREAVNSLKNYFDHKADSCLYSELSLEARHLAETYVRSEANNRNLVEKPSL